MSPVAPGGKEAAGDRVGVPEFPVQAISTMSVAAIKRGLPGKFGAHYRVHRGRRIRSVDFLGKSAGHWKKM